MKGLERKLDLLCLVWAVLFGIYITAHLVDWANRDFEVGPKVYHVQNR